MEKLLRKITNNSYNYLRKDRHIIARQLGLSDQEYRLWDLLLALYSWDPKYEGSFGTVEVTTRELADILKWSQSKVSLRLQELREHGVIRELKESLYDLLVVPEKDKTKADSRYVDLLMNQFVLIPNRDHGYSLDSPLVSSSGSYIEEDKIDSEPKNEEDLESLNLQSEELV